MGHTISSMDEDGVDNNLKCGEQVQVISEKKFCMLNKNHCYILVKEVADICPCLKSLHDAEMKNSELILLGEEILKQSNMDSVMWILVLSLMKICNERSKLNKEKYLRSKRT